MAPSKQGLDASNSQDQQQQQQQQHEQERPADTTDVAQAYRDLTRGEQAAAQLEANLSNLESRLDSLLAAFEAAEKAQLAELGQLDNEPRNDPPFQSGAKGKETGGEPKDDLP